MLARVWKRGPLHQDSVAAFIRTDPRAYERQFSNMAMAISMQSWIMVLFNGILWAASIRY